MNDVYYEYPKVTSSAAAKLIRPSGLVATAVAI